MPEKSPAIYVAGELFLEGSGCYSVRPEIRIFVQVQGG